MFAPGKTFASAGLMVIGYDMVVAAKNDMSDFSAEEKVFLNSIQPDQYCRDDPNSVKNFFNSIKNQDWALQKQESPVAAGLIYAASPGAEGKIAIDDIMALFSGFKFKDAEAKDYAARVVAEIYKTRQDIPFFPPYWSDYLAGIRRRDSFREIEKSKSFYGWMRVAEQPFLIVLQARKLYFDEEKQVDTEWESFLDIVPGDDHTFDTAGDDVGDRKRLLGKWLVEHDQSLSSVLPNSEGEYTDAPNVDNKAVYEAYLHLLLKDPQGDAGISVEEWEERKNLYEEMMQDFLEKAHTNNNPEHRQRMLDHYLRYAWLLREAEKNIQQRNENVFENIESWRTEVEPEFIAEGDVSGKLAQWMQLATWQTQGESMAAAVAPPVDSRRTHQSEKTGTWIHPPLDRLNITEDEKNDTSLLGAKISSLRSQYMFVSAGIRSDGRSTVSVYSVPPGCYDRASAANMWKLFYQYSEHPLTDCYNNVFFPVLNKVEAADEFISILRSRKLGKQPVKSHTINRVQDRDYAMALYVLIKLHKLDENKESAVYLHPDVIAKYDLTKSCDSLLQWQQELPVGSPCYWMLRAGRETAYLKELNAALAENKVLPIDELGARGSRRFGESLKGNGNKFRPA